MKVKSLSIILILHNFRINKLTEYRRKDVGFVFQFYNLVPNLTAKENIELATEISPNALDPDAVLKQVGLENRSNNFPSQLSGWRTATSVHCPSASKKSEITSL